MVFIKFYWTNEIALVSILMDSFDYIRLYWTIYGERVEESNLSRRLHKNRQSGLKPVVLTRYTNSP